MEDFEVQVIKCLEDLLLSVVDGSEDEHNDGTLGCPWCVQGTPLQGFMNSFTCCDAVATVEDLNSRHVGLDWFEPVAVRIECDEKDWVGVFLTVDGEEKETVLDRRFFYGLLDSCVQNMKRKFDGALAMRMLNMRVKYPP